MDILRGAYRRYTLAIWAMQFIAGFAFFGIAVWLPSISVSMGYKLTRSLTFVVVIAFRRRRRQPGQRPAD